MFNHPPQFSRAKHSLQGKPDGAGRLTIIYQTCGHMHDSRDAALACDFGGEFLYERRAETFEQLSQADQNRNAEWSQDDARAVLAQVIAPLEPTERRARPACKVTPRAGRFDIYMIHAGHLCGEYETAIREVFGARMGSFRCE